MKTHVYDCAESLARAGAEFLIEVANDASMEKGLFTMALSGGSTPRRMLEIVRETDDVPWEQVHIFQVDERIAPLGHPDRNSVMISGSLLTQSFRNRNRLAGLWLMPVETDDHEQAAARYQNQLEQITGQPATLDLILLGLGDDGHTASLVPGDPVLDVTDRDVAITANYRGRQRMTFTRPVIQRARKQLWLVSGANKKRALDQFLSNDSTIPASQVLGVDATVIVDQDAVPENLQL